MSGDEKKAYDVTVVPKVDLADIPKVISEVAGTAAASIPAAAAPSVESQSRLLAATEKVADRLEDTQGRERDAQDRVADRLEAAQKRTEEREERREKREWRAKMFLALLGFCSTLAGIWAATESRLTGHTVNSRMDDMIKRVEKSAFAEGQLKGPEKK